MVSDLTKTREVTGAKRRPDLTPGPNGPMSAVQASPPPGETPLTSRTQETLVSATPLRYMRKPSVRYMRSADRKVGVVVARPCHAAAAHPQIRLLGTCCCAADNGLHLPAGRRRCGLAPHGHGPGLPAALAGGGRVGGGTHVGGRSSGHGAAARCRAQGRASSRGGRSGKHSLPAAAAPWVRVREGSLRPLKCISSVSPTAAVHCCPVLAYGVATTEGDGFVPLCACCRCRKVPQPPSWPICLNGCTTWPKTSLAVGAREQTALGVCGMRHSCVADAVR